MSYNNDMSDVAILSRYEYANRQAVVVMDAKVFSSLQDVLDLVDERKALLKRLNEMEAEIITLKSKDNV